MAAISANGAVLGIDVGWSKRRKSSAVCHIAWTAHKVTWKVARFRAVEPERTETIGAVAGEGPLACAAFDGPLRRSFDVIGRFRTAERMLTRKLQPKIGKPGQSSAPVGKRLNEEANAYATTVLHCCAVAPATHKVRIDQKAVVEAFPSSFLGVMIEDPATLAARRRSRSDLFFLHWCGRGIFDRIIGHLLPGRRLASDLALVSNHDERAAFVCALTALCVAANDYTAVGDHDGWIILPPYPLLQPWAKDDLETNARDEALRAPGAIAPLFRS